MWHAYETILEKLKPKRQYSIYIDSIKPKTAFEGIQLESTAKFQV